MKIKGEYRGVLYKQGKIILDSGWQSNRIIPEYGEFLAALMKKDVSGGIDYIAVGYGSHNNPDIFKQTIEKYFFEWWPKTEPQKIGGKDPLGNDYWVWAKEIIKDNDDITYPSENNKPVKNKLQIKVTFTQDEPSPTDPLVFKEFALLWINKNSDGTIVMNEKTRKIFLINYVDHVLIIKDHTMDYYHRTIQLTFPVNEEING